MKCRKIHNVDISVCSCEQKIAYNFAFMWYSTGKKILQSAVTEEEKQNGIAEIVSSIKHSLQEEKFNKYNKESIIQAFLNGFENYCSNFFIGNSYEKIGEYFYL